MQNKDVFLMIPSDLTNYKNVEVKNEIGEYLIKQVEQNNNLEFKGDFIKCLDRHVIGTYNLSSILTKEQEEAIFTITRHPETDNGMLCIYIPLIKNEPAELLQSLVAGMFVMEINGGKYITLNDYLISKNIVISGTPKGLVFVDGELSQDEIVKILACECDPVDRIIGHQLVERASINITQYNSAKVFCSENVLLELQKNFNMDHKARIANEAIEVFFMELLLLQDAAISRICNKIIKELELEIKNPTRKDNIQILDELSCETAQAILFLDFNYFIYPTVRNAAEEIAKNFGLNKLIDKYNRYKDSLETLVNIHSNRVDEMENSNMNILLLVLTLTQVIPILAELFTSVFENRFGFSTLISFASSLGVCFILLLVFNVLRKRKLRKYKNKILSKMG